jgi:hypothetical protein
MIKITKERTTANSTFAIGGVSCSKDRFVVKESLYLRMNIFDEKSTLSPSTKTLSGKFSGRLNDIVKYY